VMTANSEDATMPKRTSLPSMLPPVRPSACIAVVPLASAPVGDDRLGRPKMNSTPHHGQDRPRPWRWCCRPCGRTRWSARAPSAKIEIICTKFDKRRRVSRTDARQLALKEAAAIGAEHYFIWRIWGGNRNRPRNGLLGAFPAWFCNRT